MEDRGFGIEIEETYGDPVAKSDFAPDWWSEADDVDFKLGDEPVTKSGGSRMNKRARAGILKPEGSTSADADLQRIIWYMYGYLDNYKFTEGGNEGDMNTHEFWGGEGKYLPSFRGIAVYDVLKQYLYGLLVEGLKLEVSDESMTVGADWKYKTEKSGIIGKSGETFTRPDDLDDDLFIMFYDVTVKLNNKALDGVATSFSFDGKNNHDVDGVTGFGSRAPQARAPAGKRENSLSLVTSLTEDTVRSILDARYGSVGAMEPTLCQIVQVPLQLDVSLCELDDVDMSILFPKCTLNVEYSMSGADRIEVTMNLATLGSETVTLKDGETTVLTDMYVVVHNAQGELKAKES